MNVDDVEIGASEAARALGLSKWETPMRLWARKLGRADPREETPASVLGRYLEPVLASIFEDTFEVPLWKAETRYHPRAPWLRSSPDYFFRYEDAPGALREKLQLDDGERVVVEMKSAYLCGYSDEEARSSSWGEGGGDHIPAEYATQVSTQIEVFDETERLFGDGWCSRGMVHALIGGRGVDTFKVQGTPKVRRYIVDGLSRFVWDHLVAEVPPEPQDLEDWGLTEELVRAPMRSKQRRKATPAEEQLVAAWRMAKVAREAAHLFEQKARTQLIQAITTWAADNYGLEGPWGHVVYTAGRELPRTSKAAAFDDIMALCEQRNDPISQAVRAIRERHTKAGFTARQLRPTWADQK